MIPKRIVLDTNVCLDLFVFHDPRWNKLLVALQSGELKAITRSDCRMEWLIVLGYAHLPLNDVSRAKAVADFDALITCTDADAIETADKPLGADADSPKLPVCRDPDDQKFLELAYASAATLLITKDKALLKLAGKARRAGMFDIMTPEAWTRASSLP